MNTKQMGYSMVRDRSKSAIIQNGEHRTGGGFRKQCSTWQYFGSLKTRFRVASLTNHTG
jgi:hypothetical protein